LSLRRAASVAAALIVFTLLACSGRFGPKRQPPRPHLDPPVRPMSDVSELFDLGAEGEAKYRGQVVAVIGKVNINATKRAPAGGTSTVVLENDEGGPPYAIATIGEDSNELLFGPPNQWRPITSVGLHGIYRERDARGTIILDRAQATQVSPWSPRPKKDGGGKDLAGKDLGPKDLAMKDLVKKDGENKDLVKKDREKKDLARKDLARKDGEKKKPEPPLIVSPKKLAQDLADDINKNYPRYFGKTLQIEGVVHQRAENKGAIVRIDFQAKIKDPKSGKPDDWIVFCGLKTPVPPTETLAGDLAVGKTVTIRGKLSGGGNGQATLYGCEIVRE